MARMTIEEKKEKLADMVLEVWQLKERAEALNFLIDKLTAEISAEEREL